MTAIALALLVTGAISKAPLADVAFMAGHWVDASGEHLSEEVWAEPVGDSMMGMWRFVSKGHAMIFELLTLTSGEDGVTMRLRHFDPKLVGREEKDRPVVLRLVAKKPGEAVFEGPDVGGTGTVRLTYRSEGKDGLIGVLEKPGGRQEFSFRRKEP